MEVSAERPKGETQVAFLSSELKAYQAGVRRMAYGWAGLAGADLATGEAASRDQDGSPMQVSRLGRQDETGHPPE